MMNQSDIKEVKALISSTKKISIIPHRNPDGDAMGSTLGLYHVLKQLGHDVQVVSPNAFPDFLAWMPGSDQVIVFEENKKKATECLQQSDIIFTLDFNVLSRTGDAMTPVLESLTPIYIMVDHHQMPASYASYTFSDTAYGSTCELLYMLLQELELDSLIHEDAARCIYTGIVTDSGSFRFPKTTAQTHRVVAALLDKGIDNPEIHNALFNNSSYHRLQLLGCALQNMVVLPEHRASYLYLTESQLNQFHHKKGDTEGFVNYGLSIDGIDFTAFFTENKEEGIIKISFRSQGNVDVNEFARTHFEGGGHINAAGGKSLLSLADTIKKFTQIIAQSKP
ncbi:DHH family phosphoesterase [Flavobacterium sp. JP2137]|uniref:DHH family phosphoesterase n=1 Tax=Flavobacterium sp. JP2137 TaxID=3414510 RepID=UPI003D2FF405